MKMQYNFLRYVVGASLVCLTAIAWGADHKEAPLIQLDIAADINDVYAFISPTNSNNLALIMTVNPFTPASANDTFHFDPLVRYTFLVSNDGDAIPDRRIHVTFTQRTSSGQNYTMRVADDSRFSVTAWSGMVTLPTINQLPNPPIIAEGTLGIRSFAGQTDDPFFFDVVGFKRFLMGTGGFNGTDGFAGANVSSIAIEVPIDLLAQGSDNLQIWAVTERREVIIRRSDLGELVRGEGPWQQVERMGNPAINTALIPSGLKDHFNIAKPENDGDFASVIVDSLMSLGTNEENINILASVAIPDTLKLDLNQPSGYPNGRRLDDDVIDTLLFFIFNQTEVPDGVPANDRAFRSNFPFLADPFQPG